MLEDEANRGVIVRLTSGVGFEVDEVRKGRNRGPASCRDDKRRYVNLGWVDVCCRGYRRHRVYCRGRRGNHPTPFSWPPTAVPVEAWVVPSMVLAAVVVASAVHAEEVRAAIYPALPEALRELLFPMCGLTEANR